MKTLGNSAVEGLSQPVGLDDTRYFRRTEPTLPQDVYTRSYMTYFPEWNNKFEPIEDEV